MFLYFILNHRPVLQNLTRNVGIRNTFPNFLAAWTHSSPHEKSQIWTRKQKQTPQTFEPVADLFPPQAGWKACVTPNTTVGNTVHFHIHNTLQCMYMYVFCFYVLGGTEGTIVHTSCMLHTAITYIKYYKQESQCCNITKWNCFSYSTWLTRFASYPSHLLYALSREIIPSHASPLVSWRGHCFPLSPFHRF